MIRHYYFPFKPNCSLCQTYLISSRCSHIPAYNLSSPGVVGNNLKAHMSILYDRQENTVITPWTSDIKYWSNYEH